MLLLLGSFFLFLARVSAQGPPEEQKFGAVLTSSILRCPDEKSEALVDVSAMEAVLYNDSMSYIDGPLIFLKPMTKNNNAELTLIKEENGQTKVVLSVCLNVCDEIINPEGDYWFILQFIDIGGACPFDSGTYRINYMILELSDMPINGSNQGCYTAKINIFDGECEDSEKQFEGCIYMTFCIEPME